MPILRVTDVGQGVNMDLAPFELREGVWSDSLNVRYLNGFARTRGGIAAITGITAPTATPYAVVSYSTAVNRFIVWATTGKVYADNGSGTVYDITRATGDYTALTDKRIDLFSFNGILIYNNGVDAPQYWNGDTTTQLQDLPNWPANAKATAFLKPFKNYLIVGAPEIDGVVLTHTVMWSSAAAPGSVPSSWTASPTSEANKNPFCSETAGAIVDGLALGDLFCVYKQDSIFGMQYVGADPYAFRFFRLNVGSDGLLAKGCVVEIPGAHVFMSPGDVRIHSGADSKSLVEGRIRSSIFSEIDQSNVTRAFLAFNQEQGEVWVCYPTTGNTACDRAWAWNFNNDAWARFAVPQLMCASSGLLPTSATGTTWAALANTWATFTSSWDVANFNNTRTRLILCNASNIGNADSGTQDFGATVSWYLEKRGISFGDSDAVKNVMRSRPLFDADAGTQVTIYHGAAMTADAVPTYAPAVTFTQGTTNWADRISTGGRFLAYRQEGSAPVALKSYDIDISAPRGRY